jgi:galactose oxidase-like protein
MKIGGLLVPVALTMACCTSSPPTTSTQAKSPPARGYPVMVGLGTNPGVLLFSGETAPPRAGGYDLGDIWLWRASKGWTRKTGLGQKYGFAFYDPKAERVVVLVTEYGKFVALSENWTYDPLNDSWQQRAPEQRPDFPNGTTAALDSESDRVIAFDGDTWAYDPAANSWRQMHPKESPAFGAWSVLAYADKHDRLILLGGQGRGDLTDVWMYDFNHDTWTETHTASGPTGRMYAGVAYDARTDRLILFGGCGLSAPICRSSEPGPPAALSDTWSYDLNTNTWSELKPKASPSGRARHAMAYDSETGNIVMFGGGNDPFHFKSDTWIFDPSTNNWSKA